MIHANFKAFVVIAAGLLLVGCADGGRRELSGAITYKGQPVPRGTVVFEPDTSRGGSGPGGIALITDGRYRTEPNFGVATGPYRIRASGYSAEVDPKSADGSPKQLFSEVALTVDIPAKGDFDIDIPATKK